MKKTHLIFTLLTSTMLIASCGQKDSKQESTSTTSSSETIETTFPIEELNAYVEETGVTIPNFESDAEWEFEIDDGSSGYDPCACAYTEDLDFAIEEAYHEVVEATDWICVNDDEYTYEDYGYIYDDPTEQVEIQFYTYEDYFGIYVFLLGEAEDIEIEQYVGETWNADFINAAFEGYSEWIDIIPEYEFATDNEYGYFEFYNGTEIYGAPYLQLYMCATNEDEAQDWFEKIAAANNLISYTEYVGDDDEYCTNNNLCETAYEAFIYHGGETFCDDSGYLYVTVTNYLDDEEEPYVDVQILYLEDYE